MMQLQEKRSAFSLLIIGLLAMPEDNADPTLVHKLQGLKEGVNDVAFHPKVRW